MAPNRIAAGLVGCAYAWAKVAPSPAPPPTPLWCDQWDPNIQPTPSLEDSGAGPISKFYLYQDNAHCEPDDGEGELCKAGVASEDGVFLEPLEDTCDNTDDDGFHPPCCGMACIAEICEADPACFGFTYDEDRDAFKLMSNVEGYAEEDGDRCYRKSDEYTLLDDNNECEPDEDAYALCHPDSNGAPLSETCAGVDEDGWHPETCGYSCVSTLCDLDPACEGFVKDEAVTEKYQMRTSITGVDSQSFRSCYVHSRQQTSPPREAAEAKFGNCQTQQSAVHGVEFVSSKEFIRYEDLPCSHSGIDLEICTDCYFLYPITATTFGATVDVQLSPWPHQMGQNLLRWIPQTSCAVNGCRALPWAPSGIGLGLCMSDPEPGGLVDCFCDDACTRYRDCCYDYQYTCGIGSSAWYVGHEMGFDAWLWPDNSQPAEFDFVAVGGFNEYEATTAEADLARVTAGRSIACRLAARPEEGVEFVRSGVYIPISSLPCSHDGVRLQQCESDGICASPIIATLDTTSISLSTWPVALTPAAATSRPNVLRWIPKGSCAALGCSALSWYPSDVEPPPGELSGLCMRDPAPGGAICFCDDACTRYRDCCYDYQYSCGIGKANAWAMELEDDWLWPTSSFAPNFNDLTDPLFATYASYGEL